jgi:hypothetical protein
VRERPLSLVFFIRGLDPIPHPATIVNMVVNYPGGRRSRGRALAGRRRRRCRLTARSIARSSHFEGMIVRRRLRLESDQTDSCSLRVNSKEMK